MVLRNMERSSTDLIDVLAFVRVVETGSFARAAERMGLSKPVLSRRVARLEEQLGARLLTRTARGAQPTEIGQAYYARAANILADLEAAQEVVAEAVTQVAGPIRLTAPLSFGIGHLAPALAEFAAAHPAGRARHRVRGPHGRPRRRRLRPRGADRPARRFLAGRAAHRAGAQGGGRQPGLSRRARPARSSPPTSPATTSCSTPTSSGASGSAADGRRSAVAPRLRSQQWRDAARRRARPGLGICMLPSFIAAPAIEDGSVEVVLRDYPLEEGALHAVMPPGRATHRPGPRAGRFPGRALRPGAGLGSVLAGGGAARRWTRTARRR